MNIKTKLKEKLLSIPVNYRAFREVHRLAEDLDVDLKKVRFYLNELVYLDILIEKKQYICPHCGETTIMDNEFLKEILEDGYFQCDECYEYINPNKDTTGYIYYDIKDRVLLENW